MAPMHLLSGPHAPILTVTVNPALDLAAETDAVLPNRKLRLDAPLTDPGGGHELRGRRRGHLWPVVADREQHRDHAGGISGVFYVFEVGVGDVPGGQFGQELRIVQQPGLAVGVQGVDERVLDLDGGLFW